MQASAAGASELLDHRQDIDACFASDSMEAIYDALQQRRSSWAESVLKQLRA